MPRCCLILVLVTAISMLVASSTQVCESSINEAACSSGGQPPASLLQKSYQRGEGVTLPQEEAQLSTSAEELELAATPEEHGGATTLLSSATDVIQQMAKTVAFETANIAGRLREAWGLSNANDYDQLLKELDTNNDSRVSLDEIVPANGSAEVRNEIKPNFEKADHNGDGALDITEMKDLFTGDDEEQSGKSLLSIAEDVHKVSAFDKTRDAGRLLLWLQGQEPKDLSKLKSDKDIIKAFDANNDGKLSLEELIPKHASKDTRTGLMRDIKPDFEKADSNGDGGLDLSELPHFGEDSEQDSNGKDAGKALLAIAAKLNKRMATTEALQAARTMTAS